MSNTPFSWRVRDLPFVARLVIAVFLCSTGVGYLSALVQLHVQQAPAGKWLPDDNDVVMTYHGKEGISILEHLVSAPETMPFSAEGSMRAAFTTRSNGWNDTIETRAHKMAEQDKVDYDELDDKNKTKYTKKAILDIRPEREGEAEAMKSWIKTGLDKKAYADDLYVLPADLRRHPLTDKFAVRNDKGEAEAVKIQSLFNSRCVKCHTDVERRQASEIPLNSYERIKAYGAADPSRGVGMSLHKLAQSTHAHLLSFSMLYLLTGFLFAMTRYPAIIRFAIAPTALIAQLIDISFWWLARLDDPYGSLFARAIVVSGGVVGACLAVQIIGTLFSLFNKVGKVIIIVLLLLALFGGWQLYVLKIESFLDNEARSAMTSQ